MTPDRNHSFVRFIAMERWEFRALFATLVVYGLIVFATYQSAILPPLKR